MYKNEYKLNRKLITEYVINILAKNTIIVGIILAIISFGLFLLDTTLYKCLIVSCLALFFAAVFTLIVIKNIEDNAKRLNNGNIEKTIVEFDKNIIMNEGKVHLEFEYDQIKKIKETKNFIVLMISSKSAILVYKNGFVNGNKDEFIDFIKSKNEQI